MDSDSSDDEQDSFTTTDVLLGYATKEPTDDPISHLGGIPSWLSETQPPSATLARCSVCHDLMSLLLQLHADLPDRFPGHDRRLHLFSCRRKTCRRKSGSVRVLRSSRVEPKQAEAEAAAEAAKIEAIKREMAEREKAEAAMAAATQSSLGNDLFGGGGKLFPRPAARQGSGSGNNPFALGDRGGAGAAPSAGKADTFAAVAATSELASKPAQKPAGAGANANAGSIESFQARLKALTFIAPGQAQIPELAPSSSAEPWPTDPKLLRPYTHLHLDADYEALGAEPAAAPVQRVQMMEMDNEDDDNKTASGSSRGKKAADEQDAADSTMDATFQKFADRLAHNPEQVLRYEFKGRPLLYSKGDQIGRIGRILAGADTPGDYGMGRCVNCGYPRAFECQLTPHAIIELEEDEEEALDGMEWGTIIVGVCSADCLPRGTEPGGVGYVEEWAGVQWEESKR